MGSSIPLFFTRLFSVTVPITSILVTLKLQQNRLSKIQTKEKREQKKKVARPGVEPAISGERGREMGEVVG